MDPCKKCTKVLHGFVTFVMLFYYCLFALMTYGFGHVFEEKCNYSLLVQFMIAASVILGLVTFAIAIFAFFCGTIISKTCLFILIFILCLTPLIISDGKDGMMAYPIFGLFYCPLSFCIAYWYDQDDHHEDTLIIHHESI